MFFRRNKWARGCHRHTGKRHTVGFGLFMRSVRKISPALPFKVLNKSDLRFFKLLEDLLTP